MSGIYDGRGGVISDENVSNLSLCNIIFLRRYICHEYIEVLCLQRHGKFWGIRSINRSAFLFYIDILYQMIIKEKLWLLHSESIVKFYSIVKQ